jgi:hypothetical protein
MPRRPEATVVAYALSALAACGGAPDSPTAPSTPAPAPTPQPTPAASTARYQVSFESTWSRETHPIDFPPDAHFSPLVGGTHSSRVRFWAPGATASAGIQAMAERGRTSPLDSEVQAAISAGTAAGVILGGAIARSPGDARAEFEIQRDHPLVTLVTMVAPSPDWFVGVDSLSLVEAGDWVAEKVATLEPWDAGTDSGATYAAADLATQPRGVIRRLDGHPVSPGASVTPFGTFRFRRLN